MQLERLKSMMQKLYILVSAVFMLTMTSCRPDVEPLFIMEMEVDFEIPAGLSSILTHTFLIRNINNPLDGYSQTFGVDTSQIITIQPGRGELFAIFGETNYDFVNRVSVWITASDNPDFRRELFYLDFNNNNNNGNTLRLLSSASNIKRLLTDDTFDIEVKLDFRSFSPRLIENRLIFNLVAYE